MIFPTPSQLIFVLYLDRNEALVTRVVVILAQFVLYLRGTMTEWNAKWHGISCGNYERSTTGEDYITQ